MGMKEAIEAIGGTIMEVSEIEEETKKRELIEKSREKDVEQGKVPGRLKEAMSPKEVQLQKRKTMIDMQIARDRRKQISQIKAKAPTKEVGEGYAPGDIDQKVGAVTAIPKKDRDAARDRLLAKAKAKREKMKEELSIDQQMKISREAAKKRKSYQPGDREKQRAAQLKQIVKNSKKDTRTDAEKMTDATGPRPGSRYRGD
jgi:hypothetical protein